MAKPATALPLFQLEDYLSVLRALVVLAWLGVAGLAAVEAWIRLASDFEWPKLGGFSTTYNGILLEFTLNTMVLTTLLVYRDWFERVPRESEYRVRWLLTAVLIWEGLHLFGAFHVTGSIRGPLMPLLPVVLVAALIVLPGRGGWLLAAYLLAGHVVVVLLENNAIIQPRGQLAQAFAYSEQASPLGLATLVGVIVAALALALLSRRRLHAESSGLHPAQYVDYDTGLFRRVFLLERIRAELGRARRQGGYTALLLLALENLDTHPPTDQEVRDAAATLIGQLRLHSDTPANYGHAVFAVLLPATNADGVRKLVQRVTAGYARTNPALRFRVAAAVTNDTSIDGSQMTAAAEEALHTSRVGGEAVVVAIGAAR